MVISKAKSRLPFDGWNITASILSTWIESLLYTFLHFLTWSKQTTRLEIISDLMYKYHGLFFLDSHIHYYWSIQSYRFQKIYNFWKGLWFHCWDIWNIHSFSYICNHFGLSHTLRFRGLWNIRINCKILFSQFRLFLYWSKIVWSDCKHCWSN